MHRKLFSLLSPKGIIVSLQLSFLTLSWSLQESAWADLLHLKNGSVVDIGWDYHQSGDKLIIQKTEGTIAIPLSDVDRVEKTQRVSLPPSSRGPEVSQPREQPEPETPGAEAGREVLRRVAQEALDFLGRLEPSGELTEELRREGLQLSDTWMQDTNAALQLEGDSQEDLRAAGEDLMRAIGELQGDLQSSTLDPSRDLEGSFRQILERL